MCYRGGVSTTKPEAPVVEVPEGPVELVANQDYILSILFGGDYCDYNDAGEQPELKFYKGARNSNHAILFELIDPSTVYSGWEFVISYKLTKYDSEKDAQVCVQPASNDGADYSNQRYPILFNRAEPAEEGSFKVDCDLLLKSSVKKNLAGVRICSNGGGTYEKYVWQDEFSFAITSVTLQPKEEE